MNNKLYQALISPFRSTVKAKPTSLYQKVGGESAIDAVVDHLYARILGDKHLKGYFDGICMHYQRYKMKVFLTMVLGGPVRYTGKDLRVAHARLVKQGLSSFHFDRVLLHLRSTLELLNLDVQEIDETMAITASTRDDVLNR
jgi:hemoglobin